MKKKLLWIFWADVAAVLACGASVYANEGLFYKEVNLVGAYSSRDGWMDKSPEQVLSVGFEDYRKFSGEFGDYLTTDLQMRFVYDSTGNAGDAWGVQIHNAWLRYRLGSGVYARLGHFDPAFGLEPQVDTHSTLLQTLAIKDMGFKKDWGLGLEGSLATLDYKMALQLGSGMAVYRKDGSFLLTARIGTPETENFQYGLSILYGNVLQGGGMNTFPRVGLASDEAVLEKRVGLDSQYLFGPYLFKAEAAYGQNDHKDVVGYLGEIDYTFPKYQNCEIELQFQSWINDLGSRSSDDSTVTLGFSYKMNQSTTLRTAFSHDFHMTDQKEEDKIVLQLYYFGL